MTDNKSKQTIEEEENIIIVDSESEEDVSSNNDIIIDDDEIEESSIIMIGNISYSCNELIYLVENNYNTLDDESRKIIEQTISHYISSFIYCLFKTIYSKQSFERLKNSLMNNDNLYNVINICCSNKVFSFSKQVIDTIIKVYELIFN